MALSKSLRIKILLGIDTVFFLLEIIVGYTVHSLALVADSFHMLNDIISLLVGLWAVNVASSKASSTVYTYGWQRAETLGALINGVFLVALCVSIFLEAIQRFFELQEVSHPVLILGVGCAGLVSNIVGLVLFHDHGHGHSQSSEEEGHNHGHAHSDEVDFANEEQPLPRSQSPIAQAITNESTETSDTVDTSALSQQTSKTKNRRSTDTPRHSEEFASAARGNRKRSRSRTYSGLEEIIVHPASFRDSIIAAGRIEEIDSAPSSVVDEQEHQNGVANGDAGPTDTTPLLSKTRNTDGRHHAGPNKQLHKAHKHARAKEVGSSSHGHSHDLNMRGVFLHVLGDALGNIGVIATALFIWLTDFEWRFYADPVVSLVITVIILCSAIPLCKAASRILLQAVPAGLNIEDIKEDIMSLPDIRSCHHLHVWQLSDTKLIASLHVQVDFEFKGEGSQRYMEIARQIRQCLHEYGIHSSTIQPEFCCEAVHGHKVVLSREQTDDEGASSGDDHERTEINGKNRSHGCLLDCEDGCGDGVKCCSAPAEAREDSSNNESGS